MEPKHADLDDDVGCKISKIKLSGSSSGTAKLTHLDDKSTPSASDFVGGKADAAAEAKLDLEVEREWKQIQNEAGGGKIEIANNPRARRIAAGLVMYAVAIKVDCSRCCSPCMDEEH